MQMHNHYHGDVNAINYSSEDKQKMKEKAIKKQLQAILYGELNNCNLMDASSMNSDPSYGNFSSPQFTK